MSKQNRDLSISDISKLLNETHDRIQISEEMSKKSREKLKKINDQLDEQKHELINMVSDITLAHADVSNLEKFNHSNDTDFMNNITKVLNNLRKIRNSLADIIRKG
jgi:DNA-binding transcriptional MerR regulator